MGIPYYIASILRKNKHIQKNCNQLVEYDTLGLDFNCFIHKYLKAENPVGSVICALYDFFETVARGKRVYIAIDGLVPFAKIVQQRYRRFRKPDEATEFDKHQISPGTKYMKDLGEALKMCFPDCIVSDTEEPGEGEHKIFRWFRSIPEKDRGRMCVYGLDADLVLIALAQRSLGNMEILREREESGFAAISIDAFAQCLPVQNVDEYIQMCIYCFGNDFMPPIAIFSLREDGYARALHYLQQGKLQYAAKDEEKILLKRRKDKDSHIIAPDAQALEERVALHLMDGVLNWEKVTFAFWKTFWWTYLYFTTSEAPDWCWYYPYPEAPLMKTIINYPRIEKTEIQWEHKEPPYSIQQQLEFILPEKSLGMECKFPDELYDEHGFDMRHMWMRHYKWECDPFISLPWNPAFEPTTVIFLPTQS